MTIPFPYHCAVITGASSGIGEALALRLSPHPIHLVLVARREDLLQATAAKLKRSPDTVTICAMDVTRDHSDAELAETLARRGLQVDLLVNNAGFGAYGFFHELPIDRMLEMIDLNIKALVRWTHRFLAPMVQRDHGAVINISSTAGFQPVPFMTTYAATKAFVTSFTAGLASELRDSRVRFVNVCPGRTRTNFQVVAGSNRIKIRSHFATADQVAVVTWNALRKNRSLVIEGLLNKLGVHFQRLFPRRMVIALARSIFQPRPR